MEEAITEYVGPESGQEWSAIEPESQSEAPPTEEREATMEQALAEEYSYLLPRRGDIRQGEILSINPHEIIVDIGLKREVIVQESDLDQLGKEALAELKVGQQVPVYILKSGDMDSEVIVSIYRARVEQDWLRAQNLMESGQAWEGEANGYNKGGLIIPFGYLRGFLPSSQLSDFPRGISREERISRLAAMVGQELLLKVIEVDRSRQRLIFSERMAEEERQKRERERFFESLQEGQVRRGVVSSLCDFGAFVDLGGVEGLIHISELSWDRVRNPREMFKVGDNLEVYILRIDRGQKRIGLSLKRLEPEPWTTVGERYKVGQLVEGVVTNVTDFGAFARIEPGVEGLIHISELSPIRIGHPSEVVKEGDVLLLRIIKLDGEKRRLGLSLKQVSEEEREEWLAGELKPD